MGKPKSQASSSKMPPKAPWSHGECVRTLGKLEGEVMAGVLAPGRFPSAAFRTLDWAVSSGPPRLERMGPVIASLARMKSLGIDLNGQDGGGMGIVHRLTEYSSIPESLALLKELDNLGLEFDHPTRSGISAERLCSSHPVSQPFRLQLEVLGARRRLERACEKASVAPPSCLRL